VKKHGGVKSVPPAYRDMRLLKRKNLLLTLNELMPQRVLNLFVTAVASINCCWGYSRPFTQFVNLGTVINCNVLRFSK
jgi:hypothetical protein